MVVGLVAAARTVSVVAHLGRMDALDGVESLRPIPMEILAMGARPA